jgi:hypothetical protein
MAIKWEEVQTKVVTWGIITLLGLTGANAALLIRLEMRLNATEEKLQMVHDNLLAYWEHLE